MTVPTTVRTADYVAPGGSHAFPVNFPFYELAVFTRALGEPPVLVEPGGYVVSGGNGAIGAVTFAPVADLAVIIVGATARGQQVRYGDFPNFPMAAHQVAMDRMAMSLIEQDEAIARTLTVAPGETAPMLGSLANADGKVLGILDGQIVPVENASTAVADDVAKAQAASFATADDRAAVAADLAAAEDAADLAAVKAGLVQNIAAMGDPYPNSAATAVPKGVTGTTGLTAGSGGTNGTFALGFSGGGGTGAAGTFTVAGGALVSAAITAHGYGYTSAPTLSLAASSGLTGAALTAVVGFLELGNYSVASADSMETLVYRNNAGTPAAVNNPDGSHMSMPQTALVVDALSEETTVVFGTATPTAGSVPGLGTWMIEAQFPYDGTVEAIFGYFNATGTIPFRLMRDAGSSNYDQVGSDISATVAATGDQTLIGDEDFDEFDGLADDRIAFYSDKIDYNGTVDPALATYGANGSDVNTLSVGGGYVGGVYFQIGFRIRRKTLVNLKDKLDERPRPMSAPSENTNYYLFHRRDDAGFQQVVAVRKSDLKFFALTSGSQHSEGTIAPGAGTVAYITQSAGDAAPTSYAVPIEGGTFAHFTCTDDLAAMGDSETSGVNNPNPGTTSWPAQYATAYGVDVYQGGVAGENLKQVRDRFLALSATLRVRKAVIWAITNGVDPSVGYDPATAITYIAAMLAAMPVTVKQVLILPAVNATSEPSGSSLYITKMALNNALAAHYPQYWYDLRAYFATKVHLGGIDTTQALHDAAITPTSGDIAAFNGDAPPPSLMVNDLHYNTTANGLIKTQVHAQFAARGQIA